AKTVCETGFRNMTYVRDLAPMLVGEPPALLGDDSAPNPSETALAALGSCVSVGKLANETHRGVTLTKIEVEMEGDIDISAVWGVGDTPDGKLLGLSAVCLLANATHRGVTLTKSEVEMEGDIDISAVWVVAYTLDCKRRLLSAVR